MIPVPLYTSYVQANTKSCKVKLPLGAILAVVFECRVQLADLLLSKFLCLPYKALLINDIIAWPRLPILTVLPVHTRSHAVLS